MKMLFLLLSVLCMISSCLAQAAVEAAGTSSDWTTKHQTLITQTTSNKANVKAVFVGDSITEGWGWSPDWGLDVWNQYYKPRGAFNYGIGGDKTQNVLYRISHNEFDGLTPKVVVVLIGTNNIGSTNNTDTATAIKTIVANLKAKMASAKYILIGVLPRDGSSQDSAVSAINSAISGTSGVTYLDFGSHFRASAGSVNASVYRDDKLHINANGYKLWHDLMETTFAAAL